MGLAAYTAPCLYFSSDHGTGIGKIADLKVSFLDSIWHVFCLCGPQSSYDSTKSALHLKLLPGSYTSVSTTICTSESQHIAMRGHVHEPLSAFMQGESMCPYSRWEALMQY